MTTHKLTPTIRPHALLPRVFKLAFPVAIQSALVAILALADVLMVSDFGQHATAAVGIASRWQFVAIMIMAGMAAATGVLVSQYWGKGDKVHAKTVTMQSLMFGSVVIIPVTALITLFASQIMLLQTTDSQVIEAGATYMLYSFPVLLLTHWIITIEASLRSSGDAMLPLIIGAVTIALNIALNFVFIHGMYGLPEMGVAGAAFATTVSRMFQVAIMWGILVKRRSWIITSRYIPKHRTLWMSFKKLAIPSSFSAVLWASGTLTYQMIIGHMGTTELAVYSMIGPFESLCYSIFFGISVACSVLIGQSLGRDEFDDAQMISKTIMKSVIMLGVTLGALLLLGREYVIMALNLDSPELSVFAEPALAVMACAIWVRMLNMIIINGVLRAGGEHMFFIRMDLIAMWMIGIPLTAYGAFIGAWDFTWVYLAIVSEEFVRLFLCFRRYLQKRWVANLTLQTA
ncbi:MATE family efflux transporter [Vibrio sp. SCSIO 43136]|uniref:MATE family efflux transporter n=1 Tax=Vibrio sp. SCSIO 43136 TaxID=2819101 RepID=UPI0020752BB2|nr:MATE family efflux transporter [Vibrio sp. SCSIO 43136]USD67652.1 MATE family efflux transporter [Vibrio sp. SCSIO 43136]